MKKIIIGCVLSIFLSTTIQAQSLQQKVTDVIYSASLDKTLEEANIYLDTLDIAIKNLERKKTISPVILGYLTTAIQQVRMIYSGDVQYLSVKMTAIEYNDYIIDTLDEFFTVYNVYYEAEGDVIQPSMDNALLKLNEVYDIFINKLGTYRGDISLIESVIGLLDDYYLELTVIYPAIMDLDVLYEAGELTDKQYEVALNKILGGHDKKVEESLDLVVLRQQEFADRHNITLEK